MLVSEMRDFGAASRSFGAGTSVRAEPVLPSHMTHSLLIVSGSFPFGEGSDFLGYEIGAHAATFDRLVLLPLVPHGPLVPVPSNVEVDTELVRLLRTRPRRVLTAFRSRWSRRLLREALRSGGRPPSLDCWLHLLAAVGIAEGVHSWGERHREDRPELALTVWAGSATLGAARSGIPTVTRAHGADLYAERHPHGYMPLQREILRAAAAIHPVSSQGAAYLAQRFPEIADRISVRHLGVPGVHATADRSSDGVLRIVSCSSLTAVKRPRLLAEIVGAVGLLVPFVEWDHFGAGPLEKEVHRVAAGFARSLRWTLHGQVLNRQILEHYEANPVDVFLNSSSSEGVPVSMMEAMSAGIPVVAPAVGGIGDIVNGRNGRMVPADLSAPEIAACLVDVVNHFVDVPRASLRNDWERNFSAETNYRALSAELKNRAEFAASPERRRAPDTD